jgi:hypothetical protein
MKTYADLQKNLSRNGIALFFERVSNSGCEIPKPAAAHAFSNALNLASFEQSSQPDSKTTVFRTLAILFR